MFENEVLSAIDNISETIDNSSFHVLESMVALYSKETDFMDFCSDEYKTTVVMEGEILDNVKKAGAKDSNKLITFLKFLPRLIIEIGKTIANAFNKSNIGTQMREFNERVEATQEVGEKEQLIEQFNQNGSGIQLYYDEKTGKVKFRKSAKDIVANVLWISSTALLIVDLFENIKNDFDVTNPSNIRQFNDQCDSIIRGRKNISNGDLFDLGLDALGDGFDRIKKTATLLTVSSGAASAMISKKITELEINKESVEDHTKLLAVKQLSEKVAIISAAVAAIGAVVNGFNKISPWMSRILHATDHSKDVSDRAIRWIRDELMKENPELARNYPQENGENDEDYCYRLLLKDTKQKHPDWTDKEIRVAVLKYLQAIKKDIRKDVKANDKADTKAEHERLKNQYYETKRRFHEENPIFGRRGRGKHAVNDNADVTEETYEVETDDNEVIDEMTDEELMEMYRNDPRVEIIDGIPYSKTIYDSLQGGPPTKKEAEIRNKINRSVLSMPLGNKKAYEHWKNNPEDRHILYKYGTSSYREGSEDQASEEEE